MSDRSTYDRDELVHAATIAERMDPRVTRQYIGRVAESDATFPAPVQTIGRSRLYRWGDVAEWLRTRGERTWGDRGRLIRLAPESGSRLMRLAEARGLLVRGQLLRDTADALVADLLKEAETREPSPEPRRSPRRRASK